MSRHARSSYVARDSEGWLFFERGKDATRLFEPSNFEFQLSLSSVAYTHLFGRQDQSKLPSDQALENLGLAVSSGSYDPPGDSDIPAGYTYLGQFIFHDISFLRGDRDPVNERTAALDLDSVLPLSGLANPETGGCGTGPLAIGCTSGYVMPEDLPRRDDGSDDAASPLIGDRRNDDFLPLSQCHLALLKFFNAIAIQEGYEGPHNHPPNQAWWLRVRKIWLQHFQSVVLHDYLPRVIDRQTYASVMRNGRALVRVGPSAVDQDWLPIEFAVAAARFGHSMIRDRYHPWNAIEGSAVFRDFILSSYANSGDRLASTDRRLFRNWVTNWLVMLDFTGIPGFGTLSEPIYASLIDTHLAPALAELPSCLRDDVCFNPVPGDVFPLAVETLKRGRSLEIATAQQAIAITNNALAAIQQPPIQPVPEAEIPGSRPNLQGVFSLHQELLTATPLWYYILREAEYFAGGCHLGPLASRLVMEVVQAAIGSSDDSILHEQNWRPTLPSAQPSHFTMADLIKFSGNPNPLN